MNKKLKVFLFACMMAALAVVATLVVHIPVPGGSGGYVNVGDSIVYVSGILPGGVWGALAAGIGSALADLISGAPIYIAPTFIIKFLMALVVWLIMRRKLGYVKFLVSCLAAGLIMVAGYFLYEAFVLGYGMAALASVAGNLLQGICAVIISTLVFGILKKAINKL